MSLSLNGKKNKDFKKVEEGQHLAMPVQVIDLGNQYKTDWKTGEVLQYEDSGEDIIQHVVYITFEFPTQTDVFDGVEKPLWLSKRYPVSTHEKSGMAALIKATVPKAANLSEIIGVPLLIDVGMTEKGNPKVVGLATAPKKIVQDDDTILTTSELKLFNTPKVYSLEDGKNEVYQQLPKWIQDIIDDQADALKPRF